jgi:hypothetical protein
VASRGKKCPTGTTGAHQSLANPVGSNGVHFERPRWIALDRVYRDKRSEVEEEIERSVREPGAQSVAVGDIARVRVIGDTPLSQAACQDSSENAPVAREANAQANKLLKIAERWNEIRLCKELVSNH